MDCQVVLSFGISTWLMCDSEMSWLFAACTNEGKNHTRTQPAKKLTMSSAKHIHALMLGLPAQPLSDLRCVSNLLFVPGQAG